MRQIVDVAEDVFGDVRELLEAELEDTECDVLVLGAVVLHQRGSHEYVVPGSGRQTDIHGHIQKYEKVKKY